MSSLTWLAFLATIAIFLGGAQGAENGQLAGKVVAIADGDTLTVLTPQREQVKVRLIEIDAPEAGQPWGARSKQGLSSLVFGKAVVVKVSGADRWGRKLGRVYVGGQDVNAEMVRRGHAWAYREYLNDQRLVAVEREARVARRGLWSMPNNQTVPPWEWRRGRRTINRVDALPESAGSDAKQQCGSKRYCSEMNSCSEARYYLTNCRLASLDGDGDGRPCEKLCR